MTTNRFICVNTTCPIYNDNCPYNEDDCPLYKRGIAEIKPVKTAKERPKKDTNYRPLEADEQKTVVEWCEWHGVKVIHIPNEGKRSFVVGAKLREQGLQKGVPDLFFPVAKHGYHGLFIEMKRDEKSKPSKEQLSWIAELKRQGYCAGVAYGSNKAIAVIKKYFEIKE